MNTKRLCMFAFVTLLWNVAATSAERSPDQGEAKREKTAEDLRRALSRLRDTAPGSREPVASAQRLFIFPTMLIDPQTASIAVVGFGVTSAGIAVEASIEGIKLRRLP